MAVLVFVLGGVDVGADAVVSVLLDVVFGVVPAVQVAIINGSLGSVESVAAVAAVGGLGLLLVGAGLAVPGVVVVLVNSVQEAGVVGIDFALSSDGDVVGLVLSLLLESGVSEETDLGDGTVAAVEARSGTIAVITSLIAVRANASTTAIAEIASLEAVRTTEASTKAISVAGVASGEASVVGPQSAISDLLIVLVLNLALDVEIGELDLKIVVGVSIVDVDFALELIVSVVDVHLKVLHIIVVEATAVTVGITVSVSDDLSGITVTVVVTVGVEAAIAIAANAVASGALRSLESRLRASVAGAGSGAVVSRWTAETGLSGGCSGNWAERTISSVVARVAISSGVAPVGVFPSAGGSCESGDNESSHCLFSVIFTVIKISAHLSKFPN